MREFDVVYKILSALRDSLDDDQFDLNSISPKKLGVSENRWAYLIKMLADEGYVEDFYVKISADGYLNFGIGPRPRITLKGLEYLEENSMMKKVYRTLKGIKDMTPGL